MSPHGLRGFESLSLRIMINVSKSWNENQKNLAVCLANQNTFTKGITLLLEMHSLVHDKKVYSGKIDTYYNELWENMNDETCRIISTKETSILWNIWHITRIEDIVSGILIGNRDTVFNDEIRNKLNIKIKDTGNAMSHSEMETFNKEINIGELKAYRLKTGKSVKKIVESLKYTDIKRKVSKEQLEKIKQNGGVTNNEKSIWLLDFWGRKNILGLIMMPVTRHQIIHLNDCFRIKKKYNECYVLDKGSQGENKR